MKTTVITVILFALSFIGIAVCLYFFTDINDEVLIAILIGYALVFVLGYLLFVALYCARLGSLFQNGKYDKVIKRSKWILKEFGLKGKSPIGDTVRLMLASAYFALNDDETFLTYINQINSKSALYMKSYLLCIYYFVKEDTDGFNNEHINVFLPLSAQEKNKRGKSEKTLQSEFEETLQLMSIYLNESSKDEMKEKLLERTNNPRVKEIITS